MMGYLATRKVRRSFAKRGGLFVVLIACACVSQGCIFVAASRYTGSQAGGTQNFNFQGGGQAGPMGQQFGQFAQFGQQMGPFGPQLGGFGPQFGPFGQPEAHRL